MSALSKSFVRVNLSALMALLLLSMPLFYGCASKRYVSKAAKLEAAGLHLEAADMYYSALVSNKTNVDALVGLKRAGQFVLSNKLSKFNVAYNNQNTEEAVNLYKEATDYYNKVLKMGVELNFPSHYKEYYADVKNVFLEDSYYEGVNLLSADKFAEAAVKLQQIIALQPDYKDAKDKLRTATYEPKYRKAIATMEHEEYRKAYFAFKEINDKAGTYRSTVSLMAECLEKGTVVVAVKKVTCRYSNTSSLCDKVEAAINNHLQQADNPFLKVVSIDNLGSRTIAPKAVLNCDLTNYKFFDGDLHETERHGYLRTVTKKRNSQTGKVENFTDYRKVIYYEYSSQVNISLTANFNLVNGRTDEVYVADTKSFKVKDDVHYARYQGNTANLVPGYWKTRNAKTDGDYVNDNFLAKSNLQDLLQARTTKKDYNTLSSKMAEDVARYVAEQIIRFVNNN